MAHLSKRTALDWVPLLVTGIIAAVLGAAAGASVTHHYNHVEEEERQQIDTRKHATQDEIQAITMFRDSLQPVTHDRQNIAITNGLPQDVADFNKDTEAFCKVQHDADIDALPDLLDLHFKKELKGLRFTVCGIEFISIHQSSIPCNPYQFVSPEYLVAVVAELNEVINRAKEKK
jgi:hypothetical protein